MWDKLRIAAAVAAVVFGAGYCSDASAETKKWSGCYVGAAVGYDWTRSEFTAHPNTKKHLNLDSVLLSPFSGCDMQMSNVVLGIMGDATWSDMSSKALNAEWQWFIGGRAGFLASPKTLVYGLVGYTALDDGLAFKKTNLGDLQGLTYGGGIEQMLGSGWAVKLEYRYVQFDEDTAPKGAKDGLKDGTDIDTGAHQVRLGVSKRFNFGN